MELRYVKKDTAKLYSSTTSNRKVKSELLWGDRVHIRGSSGDWWKVFARGSTGYVKKSDVNTTSSLLEIYFIDVGQGDGVLVRTPDDRHLLIDGGWPRKSQPTGKNAGDFVDWKFKKDYRKNTIHLDAMICSHNDQDHYGGLWDLLNVKQEHELDCDEVAVDQFFHAGLSYWKDSSNSRFLGPHAETSLGNMFTKLIGDRDSVKDGLKSSSSPRLQGEWAKFLQTVVDARTIDGDPTPMARLSHVTGQLPGFDSGKVRIEVLGPFEFEVDGEPAIRRFASPDSQNTNGNSVLLRVDYGKARVLLTGDLNTNSQQSLMEDHTDHSVFECDVAKACHHGSGDVSIRFLEKVRAAATILSSGDSEGHDHPRPEIIAASAVTGFRTRTGDKLETPLIFSTELARSVDIGTPRKVDVKNSSGNVSKTYEDDELKALRVHYKTVKSGDRSARSGSLGLSWGKVVAGTVYGLINVRTDGKKILFAGLNEKSKKWNVKTIDARF